MRVQLAQQAQEILGTSDLIITERVDDVALLIGQMVKIGVGPTHPAPLDGGSVGGGQR